MRLEISCRDRLGITQDVLDILVKYNIDLRGIDIDASGKIYLSFPNIEFSDFQHLMPEIRKLHGVTDVKTTPYMPIEKERNELTAILETLPDPVFSVDTKGRITLTNDAAAASLDVNHEQLLNKNVAELVKGFNILRWLESKSIEVKTDKVKFVEQDYLADFFPVFIPDSNNSKILAGAVILLKSEVRLGQQFSAFHQPSEESFSNIYATSANMKRVVRETKKFAELNQPLLIFGETGSGKESLARSCHALSSRGKKLFQAVVLSGRTEQECAVLLFGDDSDTDASPGVLNDSSIGTVLLKEVGELSEVLQQKLLTWLIDSNNGASVALTDQENELPRLMTSTQKDLSQLVVDGTFREDLFYRISALTLMVPSLRERKQDVLGLAEFFIKQHSVRLGQRSPKLSKSCVELLQNYAWPGNVRQLENVLNRACLTVNGREIHKEDIQLPNASSGFNFSPDGFEGTLDEAVRKFEKSLLLQLYPSFPSTRQLAKKLGLSHTAIANKLREYGINRKTIKI